MVFLRRKVRQGWVDRVLFNDTLLLVLLIMYIKGSRINISLNITLTTSASSIRLD